MPCEAFEDASYTALRKKLLRSKGSEDQRVFLTVLRSSNDFSDWMKEQVSIEQGESLPILEEALTEAEFQEPPKSTEKQIFDTWKSIAPADACRVTFWGFMTLRHIESGIIQSSFLAINGGSSPTGLERIDRVLKQGNEKDLDSVVRRVLRLMSGLPERGNRSVYVNCPLARAWWRRHLADEICGSTGAVLTDVLKVLGYSQQYWEELINLVVSRNSVLGDVKIRTALIWALSEFVNQEESKHLFQGKAIKRVQRLLGIRLAWQELGVFSTVELKQLSSSWLEHELAPVSTGPPGIALEA